MYSKVLMERFQNPKNAGGMHGANAIGEIDSKECGDLVKLYLKIEDNNMIENAKFKVFGCCATIASADVTCDLIKGKSIDDALQVTNQNVISILGDLPANKIHCSILAEESIHAAIEDYYKRKEKEAKKAIKKANENQ